VRRFRVECQPESTTYLGAVIAHHLVWRFEEIANVTSIMTFECWIIMGVAFYFVDRFSMFRDCGQAERFNRPAYFFRQNRPPLSFYPRGAFLCGVSGRGRHKKRCGSSGQAHTKHPALNARKFSTVIAKRNSKGQQAEWGSRSAMATTPLGMHCFWGVSGHGLPAFNNLPPAP
jgi:hypothetical protein